MTDNHPASELESFRGSCSPLDPRVFDCQHRSGQSASMPNGKEGAVFENRKTGNTRCQIGSLIGAGTQIRGNVVFVGGLRIDGEIKGNVSVAGSRDGTLVVGEQARIDGKLTAPHLLINGTISGPTISTEFVELQSRARIDGNIYYSGIAMHPGAAVHGKLVHCKSNESSGELELVYGNAARTGSE